AGVLPVLPLGAPQEPGADGVHRLFVRHPRGDRAGLVRGVLRRLLSLHLRDADLLPVRGDPLQPDDPFRDRPAAAHPRGAPALGRAGPTYHALHHRTAHGNYGLYTRFWDRLCKTEHPDFVAVYEYVHSPQND